jgi:hypothetical protein
MIGFVVGLLAFVVNLSGAETTEDLHWLHDQQGGIRGAILRLVAETMEDLHWLHDGLISLLGGGTIATTIVDMHWMVASFWLCMFCLAFHVVVSLLTPEEMTEDKAGLVWPHPLDALSSPGWKGIGNYKVLSVLLFGTLVVLYAILR